MFYLVKNAGLDFALYEGETKNGLREGQGTQYFPNGYKYTGEWLGNKASGQGKLEYVDGTFYEGSYKDNRIIEGICVYSTGAKYVGTFSTDERHREYFLEGSFMFANGDSFSTKWNNGIPEEGTYSTKDGRTLKFPGKEKTVFLEAGKKTSGTIIMGKSSELIEGGIKEKEINGHAILYSSFPLYEDVCYINGKYDGRYICNYTFGGYSYEGLYQAGQKTGKWKYTTVKGYEFEGDFNFKNGTVRFPFLNDDYFQGNVETHFMNMTLLNGNYNFCDEQGKFRQIHVHNIKNINEIPEVKARKFNLESMKAKIKSSKVNPVEPVLNGFDVYVYPDGSFFKGNFKHDFIYIHKKDLQSCYFLPRQNQVSMSMFLKNLGISKNYSFGYPDRNRSIRVKQQVNYSVSNGQHSDYGGKTVVLNNDGTGFHGQVRNNVKFGLGKKWTKDGHIFMGSFENGLLEGKGVIVTRNLGRFIVTFCHDVFDETDVLILKPSGVRYKGHVKDFKEDGIGTLTFTNNYKFIGHFKEGEIDTSVKEGLIITAKGKELRCLHSKIPHQSIGVLDEVEGNEVFIYSFKFGELKKAE